MSEKRKENKKIIDVREVAIIYTALDLLLIEISANKACVVKDGVVIFKDKKFIKDKSLRMMIDDAMKMLDALKKVEDYIEIAKKYHEGALKGFKNFGEHYGVVTAYSLLYEYSKTPEYNLFKIHKNRIDKIFDYLKKEAKTEEGEKLKFLAKTFINATKFGELLYKKIKGEI